MSFSIIIGTIPSTHSDKDSYDNESTNSHRLLHVSLSQHHISSPRQCNEGGPFLQMKKQVWTSRRGAAETNPTRNHEVFGFDPWLYSVG